jgi:hypothetical protein
MNVTQRDTTHEDRQTELADPRQTETLAHTRLESPKLKAPEHNELPGEFIVLPATDTNALRRLRVLAKWTLGEQSGADSEPPCMLSWQELAAHVKMNPKVKVREQNSIESRRAT